MPENPNIGAFSAPGEMSAEFKVTGLETLGVASGFLEQIGRNLRAISENPFLSIGAGTSVGKPLEKLVGVLRRAKETSEETGVSYRSLTKDFLQSDLVLTKLGGALIGFDVALHGIRDRLEDTRIEMMRFTGQSAKDSEVQLKDAQSALVRRFEIGAKYGGVFREQYTRNFNEMYSMLKTGGDQWTEDSVGQISTIVESITKLEKVTGVDFQSIIRELNSTFKDYGITGTKAVDITKQLYENWRSGEGFGMTFEENISKVTQALLRLREAGVESSTALNLAPKMVNYFGAIGLGEREGAVMGNLMENLYTPWEGGQQLAKMRALNPQAFAQRGLGNLDIASGALQTGFLAMDPDKQYSLLRDIVQGIVRQGKGNVHSAVANTLLRETGISGFQARILTESSTIPSTEKFKESLDTGAKTIDDLVRSLSKFTKVYEENLEAGGTWLEKVSEMGKGWMTDMPLKAPTEGPNWQDIVIGGAVAAGTIGLSRRFVGRTGTLLSDVVGGSTSNTVGALASYAVSGQAPTPVFVVNMPRGFGGGGSVVRRTASEAAGVAGEVIQDAATVAALSTTAGGGWRDKVGSIYRNKGVRIGGGIAGVGISAALAAEDISEGKRWQGAVDLASGIVAFVPGWGWMAAGGLQLGKYALQAAIKSSESATEAANRKAKAEAAANETQYRTHSVHANPFTIYNNIYLDGTQISRNVVDTVQQAQNRTYSSTP